MRFHAIVHVKKIRLMEGKEMACEYIDFIGW
jgi:hypothetical protein